MGGMEFNKVMGAVILALLIAMLAGFAAEKAVAPHQLTENAYKIEGVATASAATGAAAAPATATDITALLASADVAKGETLAKACAACHSFNEGGPNKVGPNLWGVVGNHHAHLGDAYAYSAAMKEHASEVWSYEALNQFLFNPRQGVPGTKMAFAGIKNDQDRANVIAYLRTLSGNPVPLP